MSTKQIYLHAGAHRTGTSSFQLCLAENRAILSRAGHDLAYPGRDGAPGGTLALRLPGPGTGPAKIAAQASAARAHLAALSPDPARSLILSEENIPGRMIHFYAGQFFPAAEKRLQLLKSALPGDIAHLVYVIRPYHDLFVSAFRKRSEDNPVAPFDDIARTMAVFDGGWPDLLGLMQRLLRPARMTVIDYRQRGESRALLARLLGAEIDQFAEPARALNTSATDAALMALQARYHAGETLSRKAWQQVIAAHQADRSDRGYAAFNPGQKTRLERRYHRDLTTISNMHGVDTVF